MIIAEYFSVDGSPLTSGQFSLLTKSKYKAVIDTEAMTGFKCVLFGNNFCLFSNDNKRLLLSFTKPKQ